MVFVESLNQVLNEISVSQFYKLYVLKSWQIVISVNMFGEYTTETMMHIF